MLLSRLKRIAVQRTRARRASLTGICSICLSLLSLGAAPLPALAQYHPEHPKVQQMVNRAIRFLETDELRGSSLGEYAEGGPILIGYTVYKVTGDPDHPLVKQGLAVAQRLAANINKVRHQGESKVVYEASVAAVFLCTVDAAKYDYEIREVLYWYSNIQKDHGGFGYLARSTGDTSQVQYVMLALWTMDQVNINIPPEIVEGTIRYLKATMDPSGGWGYQGVIGNGQLVQQEKVSKSLATAGLGALIIAGDILNFYGERSKKDQNKEDGIPEVFARVDLEERRRQQAGIISMSRSDTDGPINRAIRYQNTTQFSGLWFYYWLYSQERYESFVEIVNNRQEKSPAWYNQGVDQLARVQDENGGWGTQASRTDHTPPGVSTSLAVLFLIRSTQKAIGKLDEAFAVGGYTLPTDVSNVRRVGDRIVSDQEASVESLISMLEEDKAAGVEVGLLPKNLQLTKDPEQRKEQINRLTRLLMGPDFKARRIAAKLLGRSEQLDVAPDLIFALTDDDPYVPMIAEESLRLLSRKLGSGTLDIKPSLNERKEAVEYWKKWYLGLKPDYIFIDQ